jgi:hypothetical protein
MPVAHAALWNDSGNGAPLYNANRRLEFRQGLGSETPAGRSAHTSESRMYRLYCRPAQSPIRTSQRRSQLNPDLLVAAAQLQAFHRVRNRRDRDVPTLYVLSMGIDSRPHRPP